MTLRTSWVRSDDISETDFPLNNLPYGVFSVEGQAPRCGVAIGEMLLDVGRVDHGQSAALFAAPEWNAVMEGRRTVRAALRTRLTDLLSEETHRAAVEPHLGQQADAMLPVRLRFAEHSVQVSITPSLSAPCFGGLKTRYRRTGCRSRSVTTGAHRQRWS
jgi:fumarylacetoacetase